MAQIVKLRRSSVPGQKPTNSNLQLGELALNTTDGKVYMAKSGSLGPSVEELITTNTVNTGSINITGDITGSIFTGSFKGDGSQLYNIPASGVTGLNLNKIISGSVSASISPDKGFEINTNTIISGTLIVTSGSGVINNGLIAQNSNLILTSGSNIYVQNGGTVSASAFSGSAAGLTNVPFQISGSDILGNQSNKTFTKLHFDSDTGLNVSESAPGTAFVSIGSHFKDIFVSGQPLLRATGSDSFEIIGQDGIGITTSITDTNSNGYIKELKINATSLSSSLNNRMDTITGSINSLSSSVVLTSQTSSMTVLSSSYATTASFALNSGGSAIGSYSTLVVTSAASTWSFTHNTGQRYPIFQVFDNNGYVVIPSQIQTIDDNNANIIFPSPQTGRVIASLGGGNGTTQEFTNSNLWVVNHYLGTDYPDVTIWDSNRNIIFPNRIESVNINQIKVYFSAPVTGHVSVSRGGHLLSGSANTIEGLVSGSSQIIYSGLTGIPSGIVSGSSQLTGSYDTRYVLSGSITQTTWDNIANKPSGLISGSVQVELTGTTGYSTFSSSVATTTSGLSSSIGSLSSSVASIDNTQNGRLDSLENTSGSIRSDFNTFTSSYTTGAFTGSFKGDGTNLYNIPASGVTGLNLNKIISGSVSASISPDRGLEINTNVYIDGSLTAKELFINYISSSVLYQSGSTKFGDTSDDNHLFTGSVLVDGKVNASSLTGSINFNNLTNVPTLVSGSSQIDITGTTGYSTFSSSVSTSIGSLSSSVATTTSGLSSSIGSLSSSVSTSIGLLSSSVATTTLDLKNRVDSIESITGSISSLNSFTSSINTTIKSKLDSDGVISGSIQVIYSGLTGIPSGIVSSSSQISEFGFLETGSFNTYTSSTDSRLVSVENATFGLSGSFATTLNNSFVGTQKMTGSLIVSSSLNVIGTQNVTGSLIVSNSLKVIGNENINGNLSVTGSVVISGSLDISNANVGSSRYLHTQNNSSATWSITHNLNYNYPNVTVYDGSTNKVMLPADVTSIDVNTTQITFATPEYGYALVSVGGITTATADRFLFTATSATGSWVIDHNMGYKYVNIDVYDNNDEQLIPQKVTAVSVNRTQVDFSLPTSGNAIITLGGPRSAAIFNQTGSFYNTTTNIGITGSLVVTGDVDANNFNTTSDKKLKIDLIRIEGALDKIEKLNGYTFNWLEEYSEDRTRQIGLIADEVYEVQPELISNRSILLGGKEEEIKLLDYSKVTALLLEGIKELTKRITKLENKRKKK